MVAQSVDTAIRSIVEWYSHIGIELFGDLVTNESGRLIRVTEAVAETTATTLASEVTLTYAFDRATLDRLTEGDVKSIPIPLLQVSNTSFVHNLEVWDAAGNQLPILSRDTSRALLLCCFSAALIAVLEDCDYRNFETIANIGEELRELYLTYQPQHTAELDKKYRHLATLVSNNYLGVLDPIHRLISRRVLIVAETVVPSTESIVVKIRRSRFQRKRHISPDISADSRYQKILTRMLHRGDAAATIVPADLASFCDSYHLKIGTDDGHFLSKLNVCERKLVRDVEHVGSDCSSRGNDQPVDRLLCMKPSGDVWSVCIEEDAGVRNVCEFSRSPYCVLIKRGGHIAKTSPFGAPYAHLYFQGRRTEDLLIDARFSETPPGAKGGLFLVSLATFAFLCPNALAGTSRSADAAATVIAAPLFVAAMLGLQGDRLRHLSPPVTSVVVSLILAAVLGSVLFATGLGTNLCLRVLVSIWSILNLLWIVYLWWRITRKYRRFQRI